MGGCFDFQQTSLRNKQATDQTLHDLFRTVVERRQWESGHGGYSGTFAEKHTVRVVRDHECADVGEAERWMEELPDDKWGPAIAVWATDPGCWCFGGWCSS